MITYDDYKIAEINHWQQIKKQFHLIFFFNEVIQWFGFFFV